MIYKLYRHFYTNHQCINAATTLLAAANSAVNPILYYWRMPALREYVMTGIRRMSGLNREVRKPVSNNVQQAETKPCDRVVENINIAEPLPAPRNLETRM